MSITSSSLHDGILSQIFSYLTIQDLDKCCQVNQQWHVLASDDSLWKNFAREILKESLPEKDFKQAIKEAQILRSNDAIVRRVKVFLAQLQPGQNGMFTCIVPASFPSKDSEKQTLSVTIVAANCGNRIENRFPHFEINEQCTATHEIKDGSLISKENFEKLQFCRNTSFCTGTGIRLI